jgi:hypothetical protein
MVCTNSGRVSLRPHSDLTMTSINKKDTQTFARITIREDARGQNIVFMVLYVACIHTNEVINCVIIPHTRKQINGRAIIKTCHAVSKFSTQLQVQLDGKYYTG